MSSTPRTMAGLIRLLLVGLASLFVGISIVGPAVDSAADSNNLALKLLKQQFQRPETVPFPAENPYSDSKADLGQKLFFDPRLSRDRNMACASCHRPQLGWEDGQRVALGAGGSKLDRHTPSLWNLAWGEFFFWDGRADTLEAQAAVPIQNHVEMNLPLQELLQRLQNDPNYRQAFAGAFPDNPVINNNNLVNALATYERTLVSPQTRFDRWVAGEGTLAEDEQRGFLLFTGKANCVACHSGWSFTDHAFHDIGLPDDDPGRGRILGLDDALNAFKTPTLRDIGRRAPYMHNGALADLPAVIRHYESGFIQRPTLSTDMQSFNLTEQEAEDLIAFLHTLDSQGTIDTTPAIKAKTESRVTTPAQHTLTISQRDKSFRPTHIAIEAGQTVKILNDDKRTHNIRIHDPNLEYNSGAQEPGETIDITFEETGRYYAFCGIHPKMRLIVDVKARQ